MSGRDPLINTLKKCCQGTHWHFSSAAGHAWRQCSPAGLVAVGILLPPLLQLARLLVASTKPLCPFPPCARLLYRKLGAKLVVGMPFKDIATSGAQRAAGVPAVACLQGPPPVFGRLLQMASCRRRLCSDFCKAAARNNHILSSAPPANLQTL